MPKSINEEFKTPNQSIDVEIIYPNVDSNLLRKRKRRTIITYQNAPHLRRSKRLSSKSTKTPVQSIGSGSKKKKFKKKKNLVEASEQIHQSPEKETLVEEMHSHLVFEEEALDEEI